MNAQTELAFILRVLRLYERADNSDLFWRVEGGHVRFLANCSDTFEWATADAEEITPDDVDLLEQTLADLRAVSWEQDIWLSELYAARKRGLRPMNRWFSGGIAPGVLELFAACGPERESTFLSP